MKKFFLTGLLAFAASFLFAQNIDRIINAGECKRILQLLASDEMRGRKAFSPDIDRAASVIEAAFKSAGLQTWNSSNSYRQEFSLVSAKQLSATVSINEKEADAKTVVIITGQPDLKIDQSSGYEKAAISATDNLYEKAIELAGLQKNLLISVDAGFEKNFPRLAFLKRGMFNTGRNIVFFLGAVPEQFSIEARHEITSQHLANVVGILPGQTRKNEYVIFSGHYDHLGIGKAVEGDSIYNGANDDAAGTTAVIMLAKYFKALNNNERTLVFAAFTAEEVGGFGSQYFSKQFDPAKVMAMFNIEMIGTQSQWGNNSAYITGFDKTDMGTILQKNLQGTDFTFHPDPYTSENLFYRSDNATLARQGVPAHTISTAKMDAEPHYHKPSDEIATLDMNNMAKIIQAIALSSRGIIAGKETPVRVKPETL